jgi:hypothetical protein
MANPQDMPALVAPPAHGGRAIAAVPWLAWGAVLALAIAAESLRWIDPAERARSLSQWLCGEQADWLPFLPWLVLAPLFWHLRPKRRSPASSLDPSSYAPAPALVMSIAVGIVACRVSEFVGSAFGDRPPAYHDEFSYLFQARTYLAGRVSFPSFAPMPELFDQMHVLNEGRFASRYFPGTGLWLAPFVWLGNPWFGQWLAQALTSFLVFWIGRELGGNRTGLLAGMLTAVSPGLALFSNLLLAHHPTLVGLTLFIWQYFVMLRRGGWRHGLAAGAALTFAMLCRPMTAFGVALPFGLYTACWLVRRIGIGRRIGPAPPLNTHHSPLTFAVALAAPILAGLAALFLYNRAITGDGLQSPYQLYTEIYTPRHVYGFDNVARGEQHLSPKVLDNYDRWAENLTPQLAARNVGRRVAASFRWTLGIVPLALTALVLALGWRGLDTPCRLLAAAIVSLHAVHVPYWFDGIMGWHYVFESAPLWIVLLAVGTRQQVRDWLDANRPAMPFWWGGLLVTALAVNWLPVAPLWPGRLPDRITEVAFARQKYARFFDAAEMIATGRKAIVFVEPDPSDRHIDYVVNTPALDAAILYARYRPDRTDLPVARGLFPDRDAWLYRAASDEWQRLP